MLVKIVTFFLIGMAVLAMFGRLRFPGLPDRRKTSDKKPGKPRKCKACGSFIIGSGPCRCGKG